LRNRGDVHQNISFSRFYFIEAYSPLRFARGECGRRLMGRVDAETLHCAWVGINYTGEG